MFKAAMLYDIKWNDFQRSSDEFKNKMMPFFNEVKAKFMPAINESLVGDFIDQPRLDIPNRKDANGFVEKKKINLLQNFSDLEEMEFDQILQDLLHLTRDLRSKNYFRKIIQTKEIYDRAEKQIIQDIRSNPFELTVTKESVIINKYDDDYNMKMNTIEEDKRKETFLYHGTSVKNQIGIIDKSFRVPGIDKNVVHTYDEGYYGNGVYATNNIFYAAYYDNNLRHMKVNSSSYVLYCKAFYNKDKINVLKNPDPGNMDDDIVSNYGINYAFVGNENDYFPIEEKDKDKHFVVAEEFVFGNKNQIIPIFSFEIMRRDFMILWKDDHIDNIENSSYLKELLKQGLNIYGAKNNDEAIEIIKLKRMNKIKFITNCGPDMAGKKLIEKIRNEFHYNFICLVFTSRISHLNWVKNYPNVILTTDDYKFREYIEMDMTLPNVLKFIKDLEQTYNTKFNIIENELLQYPGFVDDIDHLSPAQKEKLLKPPQLIDNNHIPEPSQVSETSQSSESYQSCLLM